MLELAPLAFEMDRPARACQALPKQGRVDGHHGEILTAEQPSTLQDKGAVRNATSDEGQDQPSLLARPRC